MNPINILYDSHTSPGDTSPEIFSCKTPGKQSVEDDEICFDTFYD